MLFHPSMFDDHLNFIVATFLEVTATDLLPHRGERALLLDENRSATVKVVEVGLMENRCLY